MAAAYTPESCSKAHCEAWGAKLTHIEELAKPFRRDRMVRARIAEACECLQVMMECDSGGKKEEAAGSAETDEKERSEEVYEVKDMADNIA